MENVEENPIIKDKKVAHAYKPVRLLVGSFLLIIVIGTILLSLPISSSSGTFTNLLDSLFTATSATCVTGLVVFDTFTQWSIFGQVVIVALIQLGGIGLVTITTFFTLAFRKKLRLKELQLAQESVNYSGLKDIPHLLKMVITATFIIEGVGALILFTRFIPQFGVSGIWISIFTAISAYCNAGFDILGRISPGTSLTTYNNDPVVLITVSLLVIIGGIGFIVMSDVLYHKKHKHLMLHTKVVLTVTAVLITFGFLVFFIGEYHNPKTLGELPIGQKVLASYFQSVTTRTAGFNSLNFADMHDMTKVFSVMLMFIGAAPGSTGGGIKVTTFIVIIMTVINVLRSSSETTILKRRVDKSVIYKSLSIAVLAITLILATWATIISAQGDGVSTIDSLFETVSAFGTVGLTCDFTSTLVPISKIAVIITMFVGRVGPVSLILALSTKHEEVYRVLPEGQIMVG